MDIQKIRKRFLPMSETMFFILFSLLEERHGYGIMQYVQTITNGRIVLGAGTIYQSLSKLEGDGLIAVAREVDRKKIYQITPIGRQILTEEIARIHEIYHLTEGYR